MNVKVCKNCKRLFKYIYGPEICPDCMKLIPKEEKELQKTETSNLLRPLVTEEEIKFREVKDYIMAHPKATLVQIADANDTTPMKLLEWIREERLEFSDDSKTAWFECESCGAKIKSGRLCNRCKFK
ncbi:MAG: flagellar protein [Anaerocolumna sp.]|jgi:ribosomal protein L32|nr:flagellar protein [Anaerocolumna sp.]